MKLSNSFKKTKREIREDQVMLKSEIKSIRKELEKISDNQEVVIYFIDIIDEIYIVKTANEGIVIFQGNKKEFKEFAEKHPKSYFIRFNIPSPKYK